MTLGGYFPLEVALAGIPAHVKDGDGQAGGESQHRRRLATIFNCA